MIKYFRDYLAHLTIRQRLIMLNCFVFAFILVLFSAYSWQILSLERKIESIERVNRLLHNVLEVRRFEKDILLGVGKNNLENLQYYLKLVDEESAEMVGEIQRLAGPGQYREFRIALDNYENIIAQYVSQGGKLDGDTLRLYGKTMVDFCNSILMAQSHKVHEGLMVILYGFTIVPGVMLILMVIAVQVQTKNVLERLQIIRRATRDLLDDNFKPIESDQRIQDEITDLIHAFNKMANELEIKQEEVLQSKKLAAIGTFSSGIAHELNNPLNNISLSADTLMEEFDDMDREEVMDILEDIMTQTERASKIVRNLLEFSREKAPSISLIHFKDVIDSTARLIENELRIKGVHLETCVGKNLPEILGDMHKLQQVFLNLFINAIQAMPEGGLIHLDTREEPKGYIRIDVSDTGQGIPQDKIDKIFDPFFTTKAVGQGTGLGLSIVYSIIKKHGGHLEVKSKPGVGTTFSIFLPVASQNGNGGDSQRKDGLNGTDNS